MHLDHRKEKIVTISKKKKNHSTNGNARSIQTHSRNRQELQEFERKQIEI